MSSGLNFVVVSGSFGTFATKSVWEKVGSISDAPQKGTFATKSAWGKFGRLSDAPQKFAWLMGFLFLTSLLSLTKQQAPHVESEAHLRKKVES